MTLIEGFVGAAPKARACLKYAQELADRCAAGEDPRSVVFASFVEGLSLGMAMSELDPEWAASAHEELVAHQRSISRGPRRVEPAAQRMARFRQVRALVELSREYDQ